MCEMAVLENTTHSNQEIAVASMDLYRSQGHSLGIAAAYLDDEQFRYELFRETTPDQRQVLSFLDENDDAWRFIIHARLATQGEVTEENAHPIPIDCSECDIELIAHNGVVTREGKLRDTLQQEGHDYTTPVDTESIAHQAGTIPGDVHDVDIGAAEYQPCVILMGPERVYSTAQTRYYLTKDFRMSRNIRSDFGPHRKEDNFEAVLVTHPEVDND